MGAFRNVDTAAKKEFAFCWNHTDASERVIQLQRAKVMANAVATYIATERPNESLSHVQWVGRIASYNPSDVVCHFESGTQLGISCKSTRTRGGICFKNAGVRHFKQHMGLDFRPIYEKAAKDFCVQYSLPFKNNERKLFLRQNPTLQNLAQRVAEETLMQITTLIYDKLCQQSQDWMRDYCLRHWMDYYADVPWIRVTGMGKNAPFEALIEDPKQMHGPYAAPEYVALSTHGIKLCRIKNTSIGIYAGDTPVFKIRAKYDTEKLASSLKFLGEPI